MKFIHIADVHLDMPFNNLGYLGEKRRLEQIENFKKLIDLVIEEKVDYLFISGDLYEHEYVKTSTINILIEQFKRIPLVHVIIVPGNHDPYIKGSIYDKTKFPNNVRVIKGYEQFETDKLNIYAYGFTDFYDKGINIRNIELINNGKKNVFISHGELDTHISEYKNMYNPMKKSELIYKNFDYVALGHIHKSNFSIDENIIYPGSFMNYRFSEDNAGIVLGEFKNATIYSGEENKYKQLIDEKLFLEHINVDKRKYEEVNIDVSEIRNIQELVARLQFSNFDKNNYIKVNFVGNKNFELNKLYIKNNLNNENIIKIEDNTKIGYDLEEISKEKTLKGIFVKKALQKYNMIDKEYRISEEEKARQKTNIIKAIEIMLEEMRNS